MPRLLKMSAVTMAATAPLRQVTIDRDTLLTGTGFKRSVTAKMLSSPTEVAFDFTADDDTPELKGAP